MYQRSRMTGWNVLDFWYSPPYHSPLPTAWFGSERLRRTSQWHSCTHDTSGPHPGTPSFPPPSSHRHVEQDKIRLVDPQWVVGLLVEAQEKYCNWRSHQLGRVLVGWASVHNSPPQRGSTRNITWPKESRSLSRNGYGETRKRRKINATLFTDTRKSTFRKMRNNEYVSKRAKSAKKTIKISTWKTFENQRKNKKTRKLTTIKTYL